MNKTYDYLIVGAGLFGATFAHRVRQAGKRCLVIDKRSHLGGNVYTENVRGIHVHKYGAHIFHTSNKDIWKFVNSFAEFNRYTNAPVADYKGVRYSLPFNMNTFYQMWHSRTPEEAQHMIDEQRKEVLEQMRKVGVNEPRNLEEQALILVGRDIYERLIKGYTEKQWGRKCVDLPAFIIKRIPIRLVYDNNYFNDKYQGIPIGGYMKLINGMLEGIETKINTDFFVEREYWESLADKIVFTGCLDEFFDYQLGELEYRTVSFEQKQLDTPNYQGCAVVNYTDNSIPYTRIIEHKHFEWFGDEVYELPYTVISKEYPLEWKTGLEPFYPVNNYRNNYIAEQYRAMAARTPNVIFGGRLAEYKYYDMAPVIEKAMSIDLF